jgi:hypothetical protein
MVEEQGDGERRNDKGDGDKDQQGGHFPTSLPRPHASATRSAWLPVQTLSVRARTVFLDLALPLPSGDRR